MTELDRYQLTSIKYLLRFCRNHCSPFVIAIEAAECKQHGFVHLVWRDFHEICNFDL